MEGRFGLVSFKDGFGLPVGLKSRLFLLLVFGALLWGCACPEKPISDRTACGEVLVTSRDPRFRLKDRQRCFSHEYRFIHQRRENTGLAGFQQGPKPERLVGLALSGGGIRSNAFQLGILAGLFEAGALKYIDYISSVSGGTWAASAYLFNEDFFSEVESQFQEEFRPDPHGYLVYTQGELVREQWRKGLLKIFLKNQDVPYEDLADLAILKDKPYFIFNATHSANIDEMPSYKNFNFQFTKDFVGTVADCCSDTGKVHCGKWRRLRWTLLEDGMEGGFFVKTGPMARYRLYVNAAMDRKTFNDDLMLSHALAASSAVASKLYGFWLQIREPDQYNGRSWYRQKKLRAKYRLSDGGKSDNTGALSLMERGTDLIIASQMAADPNMGFDDLDLLREQAESLFDFQLNTEKIRKEIAKANKMTVEARYTESPGQRDSSKEGRILFIKPTYCNIGPFWAWLDEENKAGRHLKITAALEEDWRLSEKAKPGLDRCHASRFPQNPTICEKYDPQVIAAYYLLGKFIVAREGVADRIRDFAFRRQ